MQSVPESEMEKIIQVRLIDAEIRMQCKYTASWHYIMIVMTLRKKFIISFGVKVMRKLIKILKMFKGIYFCYYLIY